MIQAIGNLPPVIPLEPAAALTTAAPVAGAGAAFKSVLDSAIQSVQGMQQTAANAVGAVLEGKGGELHTAILATQRAELQFQLFLQMRNKMVSAYQEVMKVQL